MEEEIIERMWIVRAKWPKNHFWSINCTNFVMILCVGNRVMIYERIRHDIWVWLEQSGSFFCWQRFLPKNLPRKKKTHFPPRPTVPFHRPSSSFLLMLWWKSGMFLGQSLVHRTWRRWLDGYKHQCTEKLAPLHHHKNDFLSTLLFFCYPFNLKRKRLYLCGTQWRCIIGHRSWRQEGDVKIFSTVVADCFWKIFIQTKHKWSTYKERGIDICTLVFYSSSSLLEEPEPKKGFLRRLLIVGIKSSSSSLFAA